MLTNTLKALVKNPVKEKLSLTGFFTSTLRALDSISFFFKSTSHIATSLCKCCVIKFVKLLAFSILLITYTN